jgi:hypothetical protein
MKMEIRVALSAADTIRSMMLGVDDLVGEEVVVAPET